MPPGPSRLCFWVSMTQPLALPVCALCPTAALPMQRPDFPAPLSYACETPLSEDLWVKFVPRCLYQEQLSLPRASVCLTDPVTLVYLFALATRKQSSLRFGFGKCTLPEVDAPKTQRSLAPSYFPVVPKCSRLFSFLMALNMSRHNVPNLLKCEAEKSKNK